MTAASAQVVGVDADVLNMLDQHGSQSLFTSPAWLETIASTYGFKPMASRTADSALLFVEVDDIRSRRVVSFPFSDYCDPTLSSADEWSTSGSAHRRPWAASHVSLAPCTGGARYRRPEVHRHRTRLVA